MRKERRIRQRAKRVRVLLSVSHWGIHTLDLTAFWQEHDVPDLWMPEWARSRHLVIYDR